MSLASLNINTANDYYAGDFFWKFRNINIDSEEFDEEVDQGDKAYKKLRDFIKTGDLNGLINSEEFGKFNINYRFGNDQNTLLHAAYRWNKPEIVEFLLKNRADERIPNDIGQVPMELAEDNYMDSLPRVVNAIAQQYFQSLGDTPNNSHILFDVILRFIHEKKWKYYDTEGCRKKIPFRDGREVSSLGLPELTYHVNCSDLTNLFIKAAHKVGLDAQEVKYSGYKSIERHNKEKVGVIGELALFDGSKKVEDNVNIKFNLHYVAYSSGWHYDLTLMCKYPEKNSILCPEQI